MRKTALCTLTFLFMSAVLFARWNDAVGRGIIPFWINADDFYTLLVFVSADEETSDIIHVRFCDENGHWCSDTTGDMFLIRHREMLVFSTTPAVPTWIPTTANYGYAKFRVVDGVPIQAWALIINELSGAAMVVPAYDQYNGF